MGRVLQAFVGFLVLGDIRFVQLVGGRVRPNHAVQDRVEVDLDVAEGADPSEAVYDWAVSHGCKILAMRTEKTRLEDLLARLTGAGDAGTGPTTGAGA